MTKEKKWECMIDWRGQLEKEMNSVLDEESRWSLYFMNIFFIFSSLLINILLLVMSLSMSLSITDQSNILVLLLTISLLPGKSEWLIICVNLTFLVWGRGNLPVGSKRAMCSWRHLWFSVLYCEVMENSLQQGAI